MYFNRKRFDQRGFLIEKQPLPSGLKTLKPVGLLGIAQKLELCNWSGMQPVGYNTHLKITFYVILLELVKTTQNKFILFEKYFKCNIFWHILHCLCLFTFNAHGLVSSIHPSCFLKAWFLFYLSLYNVNNWVRGCGFTVLFHAVENGDLFPPQIF